MKAEIRKIKVDGVERSYVLHRPAGSTRAADLVIGCHGGGGNGERFYANHWRKHEDQGFAIICPTSECAEHGTNWVAFGDEAHVGDVRMDERFMLALLGEESDGRVYMSGFSSGGKMTHQMIATHPEHFSGFGVSANTRIQPGNAFNAPLRLVIGTKDSRNYDDMSNTLSGYLTRQGIDPADFTVQAFKGEKTRARARTFAEGRLDYVEIRGMTHRYAQLKSGDPFNETDELLRFWRKNAGMGA